MKQFQKLFQARLYLVFMLIGCTSQPGYAKDRPDRVDFSGSWELDYAMSENPNDKLRWLYEVARSHLERQERARRDEVRGRMPMDAATAAAINDLQGVIGLGKLTEMISRATVLTINQTPQSIIVQRDGDFSLTCDFVRRRQSDSALGQERCGWEQGQLVFIISLPEGLTVRHRLVLSEDHQRLNIATTVSSTRFGQPFSLNRVYMPFEPETGGMYECEYSLAKKNTCRRGSGD